MPGSGPSEPASGPSEPASGPSEPASGPSEPASGPSEPASGPSEPGSGPSEPASRPPAAGSKHPGSGPTWDEFVSSDLYGWFHLCEAGREPAGSGLVAVRLAPGAFEASIGLTVILDENATVVGASLALDRSWLDGERAAQASGGDLAKSLIGWLAAVDPGLARVSGQLESAVLNAAGAIVRAPFQASQPDRDIAGIVDAFLAADAPEAVFAGRRPLRAANRSRAGGRWLFLEWGEASSSLSFRQWIACHVGEIVDIEWDSWRHGSAGSACVRLVGFNERAEAGYPDGVLLAILESLQGSDRRGFSQTADGDVPTAGMSEVICQVRAVSTGAAEIVWLNIPYLKCVAPLHGPPVRCSAYDDFEIDYDDPGHARHYGRMCPLHDEPQWRLSKG